MPHALERAANPGGDALTRCCSSPALGVGTGTNTKRPSTGADSVKPGRQSLNLYYFGPSRGTCLIVMIPRPHKKIYTVDSVTPRPAGGGDLPWDPQVADVRFYNAVEYLQVAEVLVKEEDIDTVIGAHLVPLPQGRDKFVAAPATRACPIPGSRRYA